MAHATSIGIIIDGNRRWARAQGLHTLDGHREGARRVKDTIDWAKERGHVTDVFFYTLSTENWKRSGTELEYLLLLVEFFFRAHAPAIAASGVRIRIVGERTRFSKKLQRIFDELEESTKGNTAMTAWFGLSYGGRAEILEGAHMLMRDKALPTAENFKARLWTADLPDPDLIIRTGGEKRLSNFLTWSSVYSELFFIDTYWPAFTKELFFGILDQFEFRQRRMGV
jgi:undecaprenyl diphosphate synthase